jgi:4-carboxymuconolactone decarboxylase
MTRFIAGIVSLSFLPFASAQEITITASGSRATQTGSAENFTGSVRVEPLFEADEPSRMIGASVTFEPGARTAWHMHPLGQTLIVTAGRGRVQQWGGPLDEIRQGDVVRIPPNVKHWHGASDSSPMTHIALLEHLDGSRTEWMEKVTDSQYKAPIRGQASPAPSATPEATRAQKRMGDFSPKRVELTDDVLFADVWTRPQLPSRDRSFF